MKVTLPPRLRSHPFFFGVLALFLIGAVVGAVEIGAGLKRLRTEEAKLAQLRIERLTPQARPEMLAAVESELARVQERLAAARMSWPRMEPGAEADRLDAYAELSAFVERCRAEASRVGVAVAPEEHFGFAANAREAPAAEEVPAVIAQKRALERVLAALFASGPERLIGAWRESPDEGGADHAGSDWCAIERTRSVGVPELARTRVVRVAFAGGTDCLRRFLNRLAGTPGLVVREVSVAAPEEKQLRGAKGRNQPTGRRFSVTLESVELANGASVADAGSEAEVPTLWREPVADEHGSFAGELFAPTSAEQEARSTGAVEGDSGIELLAVRAVPYRWRLVGHVAGPNGGAALLEETTTRRGVLLRAGEREKKSGVTLMTLEVGVARHGGRVVRATLSDPGERAPIALTTAGEEREARLAAVLRVRGRAEPLELAEGETLRLAGKQLTVAAVRAAPAEVEIVRGAAQKLRLRPAVN
jgi:hypothetical protein